MENTRLKVRIGSHEFEAEGPPEIVQNQFEGFKRLIETPNQENQGGDAGAFAASAVHLPLSGIQLDRICKVDGRVVSLTVKPDSVGVAAMLIMVGHIAYRNHDAVTASEIKDGLKRSGYIIERVDRVMHPLTDERYLVRTGDKKGTRYRFTLPGFARAQAAAREAISQLALDPVRGSA